MEGIATEQKRMEQPMQQRNMQKDAILNRLRQRGCRITKQRMVLLDIILDGDCSSCKEIYYKASKIDPSIGSATVYRMINMLEEIGAINRRNMYRVSCTQPCDELEDDAQKICSNMLCLIRRGSPQCASMNVPLMWSFAIRLTG